MLALVVGFVSVFICFCRIGRLEPVCVCEHPACGTDLANGPLRTFDPVDFFVLLCGFFGASTFPLARAKRLKRVESKIFL